MGRHKPKYGVAQAAEMAGVGVRTIYAAFRSGNLAGRDLGGSVGILLTPAGVREWMDRGYLTDTDID